MRKDLCFCALLAPIPTRTRVSIVMQSCEEAKTSSTARLIALLLPNSEIHLRGRLGVAFDLTRLRGNGATPLLLYPDPTAAVLTREMVESLPGPLTLVVPDGTWSQAKKITRRVTALQGLPHVMLPNGEASRYVLRRNQTDGGVCTAEAVARALGIVEGKHIQDAIERHLDTMIQRVLWGRHSSRLFEESEGSAPDT
jgi:DTW domain-containing protein YfiP